MSPPTTTRTQRQRLQKLWEEARSIMGRAGSIPKRKDAEKIHELLAECVSTDPANTVYVNALLMNLRQLRLQPNSWWRHFLPRSIAADHLPMRGGSKEVLELTYALKDCRAEASLVDLLLRMAGKCSQIDAPEAEIRYLREAIHLAPRDAKVLTLLARSLLRQGRFDEARSVAQSLRAVTGDVGDARELLSILDDSASSTQHAAIAALLALQVAAADQSATPDDHLTLAAALVKFGRFDEAEQAAAKAQSLAGGDLRVREQGEEVALARLRKQVEIARRLVEHDPAPAHQATLQQWEAELNRLETATLNARSERFPQDAQLKLELALRLKRAGNYSGAIQRLEEIPVDSPNRPSVLIELGECWQHLRQFEKALEFYRQAIAAAEGQPDAEPLKLALYRGGLLASALTQTEQARVWLERLVALDPAFKDASRRLLLLET